MATALSSIVRSRPVWKDGVTEGDFTDPLQALRAAGLNYQSVVLPMQIVMPDGKPQPAPVSAIIRGRTLTDPERRFVGTVSDRYRPIQHSEFAAMLVPVAERHPLEMIGAAGQHSERVYFGFDLGDYLVGGHDSERVKSFLYTSSANDGGTALTLMVTDVRMTCLNMLPAATRRSSFNVSIRHSGEAILTAKQWIKYLDRVQEIRKQRQVQAEALLRTRFERSELDRVVEAAYPTPRSPMLERLGVDGETEVLNELPDSVRARQSALEQDIARMQRYRVAAVESYDRLCDEFPHIGGTGWAVLNAVTEQESWRRGRGSNQAESLLFGDRARTVERALAEAMQIVGARG